MEQPSPQVAQENDLNVQKPTPAMYCRAITFMAVALFAANVFAQDPSQAYNGPAQDPPGRVARVAFTQGNVSLEPAGVSTFSQAELNYPMTVGDRIYTDLDAWAELQTAGLAVRLGNGADLTVTSLTDSVAQFGLAQGSVRLRTRDLYAPPDAADNPQQAVVEVDTPNGSIFVQSAGDIRVDSYPQDDSTVVTVSSGQVEVTGPGVDQVVGPNQALRIVGNPAVVQPVAPLTPDALDGFDQSREAAYLASTGVQDGYVSGDMIGAADLDQYGEWAAAPEYGMVWYPRSVAFDWTPYHNGHWAWVAPWGWTWIEVEPWGFAPFHYGRWNYIDGRWGWIPGPPPRIIGGPIRPIYSPALVVFVGFGADTAWFPLGPGEPFQPWYHASPVYVNRVNVTNIYSSNAAQVRSTYVSRTSVAFNANAVYVNRPAATTVIAQRDFAAGRPVAASAQVKLDLNAKAQLAQAPILPHPLVTPAATAAAPQGPARAIPPHTERPVLATKQGMVRTGSPAPQAVSPQPVRPGGQSPVPLGQPTSVRPPEQPPIQPVTRGSFPQPRDVRPVAPAMSAAPALVPAAPRPADAARPLVTRTPPQAPQPAFADQQREIQRVDPGRPLGPQQVQNVRAGRPAGPASQPEQAPHPAARPASPPPVRKPPR